MKPKPKLPAIEAREKIGLTRAQAAKKLRLSERTIQLYESGRGPSFYQAKRIARLYKCKIFGDLAEQGLSQQRLCRATKNAE